MTKNAPEIFLKDYTPPAFLIDEVALDIDIGDDNARVKSRLVMRRNPRAKNKRADLFLHGEDQKLNSLTLNGKKLSPRDYKLTTSDLTILDLPAKFVLEVDSTHNPYKNTKLSGLYASGTMLCTQCEAEGFRRITYYMDRPDVMAKFKTTIHADQKKYPVLLSNGDLIAKGQEGARHFVIWNDPYPKPSYLFACVAGKLDKVSTHYKTKQNKDVLIEIYTEPGKTKETGFALTALKNAMRWDEARFNLSYDLGRFMIVATPFFNMGAMENKGLNIFNDSCVLGRPETATDGTIAFIERVVGHEYFHNWTGDRITCRDWFQLSLKEGLTVFREQEFCGDMHSPVVERLETVRDLRRVQFPEDAGPMAHAVRLGHYKTIDNFYTATVYDKGSELVRMIQTLVGVKGFNKGMALYVKRHDGQAVTCDDFVKAMADANKIDLKQFMIWYSQAGTPRVKVDSVYDAKQKILTLHIAQSCQPTHGQPKKQALHIPFAMALFDTKGKVIVEKILSLKKSTESFVFKNIATRPVLSLLRNFSAPVVLEYTPSDADLLFLMTYDTDGFNRWEAGQKLFLKYFFKRFESAKGFDDPAQNRVPSGLLNALRQILRDKKISADFKMMALLLPSESEIAGHLKSQGKLLDPERLAIAHRAMKMDIAHALTADLKQAYEGLGKIDPRKGDGKTAGLRGLRNLIVGYLVLAGDKSALSIAVNKLGKSVNMTDQVGALHIVGDQNKTLRSKVMKAFEKKWQGQDLIMDSWLSAIAAARRDDVLKDVQALMKHSAFNIKNPNRVSALLGVFAGNPMGFHARDGRGYRFIADMIVKVDALNAQAAARLVRAFVRYRDYEHVRMKAMQACLQTLHKNKKLSTNCQEIITRAIKK